MTTLKKKKNIAECGVSLLIPLCIYKFPRLAVSTQRDELKEGISRVSDHIMYKPYLFSASATLPSSHQSCTISSANCDSDVMLLPLAGSCVRRKEGGAELLWCAGRSADEGVKEEGGISPGSFPRFFLPSSPSAFLLPPRPSTCPGRAEERAWDVEE